MVARKIHRGKRICDGERKNKGRKFLEDERDDKEIFFVKWTGMHDCYSMHLSYIHHYIQAWTPNSPFCVYSNKRLPLVCP